MECLSSIFRRVWFGEMLLRLLSAPRIIRIVDNFEGKSNVSFFLGKKNLIFGEFNNMIKK